MALTTLPTTPASKATPRNGFGGASTVWPALSSSRITPANPDASAKAPWTRTTVGPGMGFSSGLDRWPPRRYVTGPEREDPGVRRPARHRLFRAAQPPRTTTCKQYPAGRKAASRMSQTPGPPPHTTLRIANVHADRRITLYKSNVLNSATDVFRTSAEQRSWRTAAAAGLRNR